jgi:hypothetical protein
VCAARTRIGAAECHLGGGACASRSLAPTAYGQARGVLGHGLRQGAAISLREFAPRCRFAGASFVTAVEHGHGFVPVNYWEVAWSARDNPVTAAAWRAAGITADARPG